VQTTIVEGDAARLIGGVSVIVTDRDTALTDLRCAVARRTAGGWGFCNAHTVNCARTIPGYRETLSRIRLFNDGIGVDLASRLLHGGGFPDNLNGTDLSPALLESLPDGTGIFLVGSPPGVADRAGARLTELFPNIRIVGTQHGFFTTEEEPAIATRIAESGTSLVLVGMGHPVQEQWAVRNAQRIAAPLLCIGAYLDFAAGIVSRAPRWVRKSRTEWLYRLAQEPRRLAGRYLVGNLTFLAAIAHEKWARR
jgi:exopolysaccharide biosynthesis WecB/TagA/CpsF family protein